MYGEKDLNKVIMNLTVHAERLTLRGAFETREGKKRAGGSDSVRALEATVIALQAEVKSLKTPSFSPRGGSSNPDKQHLRCANTSCGKIGHLIADCFQTRGGKVGEYPHWWKGKRTAQTVISNTASVIEIPGGHYTLSAFVDVNEIQKLINENLPVDRHVAALAALEDASIISNACVADSGCTSYFFKKREAFVTYTKIQTLVGQSSKSGTGFPVLGFGNVEIIVVNERQ
jgi:hypothetical protein